MHKRMSPISYLCLESIYAPHMKLFRCILLTALCSSVLLQSCNDDDSYADMKKREASQIRSFLAKGCTVLDEEEGDTLLHVEPINVISEEQFFANDSTTDLSRNEYVLFSNTGVYMQIVSKGIGKKLANGESATLINRYTEFNIAGDSIQSTNNSMYYETVPEMMTCKNSEGLFTASFTQGVMATRYQSTSVPSGWLTPLTYINLGRKSAPDEQIAHVRLIVPSTEGQNDANSNVYACFYDITYMRSR